MVNHARVINLWGRSPIKKTDNMKSVS
jgi:hypothetical protein